VKLESEFVQLRQQAILNSRVIQDYSGLKQPVSALAQTIFERGDMAVLDPEGEEELGKLIDVFIEERGRSWSPKTAQAHSVSLRVFRDYVGPKPIGLLSRKDCKDFKLTLEKLPLNWQRRFKDKDIREIAALGLPPISPATVNRSLTPICAFLNWALVEGHVSANPALRLRVAERVRPDLQRAAFSASDLSLLFEKSPMYTGCEAVRKRNKTGSLIIKDAHFWLPLIALFTGMRLEEIAQLRCRDIKQVSDIWVIDVNAMGGNRLKNQNSHRLVPIHTQLLEIGLVDHAQETDASGYERLWSQLRRSKRGDLSSGYSSWFGRYKRSIGLTDPKKTFHSFRHTFIDKLKQLDVPDGKIQELVGHANHSITTGRYGKPYRPPALQEIIEALDYGLDLRELHVDQGLAEGNSTPSYGGNGHCQARLNP
jgi:integrase